MGSEIVERLQLIAMCLDAVKRIDQGDAVREAAARITALEAMCEKMAGALEGLSKAEAEYRRRHDLCGSGHTLTGRAWDVMRRAGNEARETLAQYRGADNG